MSQFKVLIIEILNSYSNDEDKILFAEFIKETPLHISYAGILQELLISINKNSKILFVYLLHQVDFILFPSLKP
jgi:hypothetical protein